MLSNTYGSSRLFMRSERLCLKFWKDDVMTQFVNSFQAIKAQISNKENPYEFPSPVPRYSHLYYGIGVSFPLVLSLSCCHVDRRHRHSWRHQQVIPHLLFDGTVYSQGASRTTNECHQEVEMPSLLFHRLYNCINTAPIPSPTFSLDLQAHVQQLYFVFTPQLLTESMIQQVSCEWEKGIRIPFKYSSLITSDTLLFPPSAELLSLDALLFTVFGKLCLASSRRCFAQWLFYCIPFEAVT